MTNIDPHLCCRPHWQWTTAAAVRPPNFFKKNGARTRFSENAVMVKHLQIRGCGHVLAHYGKEKSEYICWETVPRQALKSHDHCNVRTLRHYKRASARIN